MSQENNQKKKSKNKKNVPSEIPIVWVNVV